MAIIPIKISNKIFLENITADQQYIIYDYFYEDNSQNTHLKN